MQEGAERIVRRILSDAGDQVSEIESDTAGRTEAILADAKKKAEREERLILEQAHKDAEEKKRRIIGVAQLEARKELLAAKQELIEEAFKRSLDQLARQDEDSYLAIIRKLLLSLVESGTETVQCNAADRKRIPSSFWDEINQTLVTRGKKGELKVSDEARDIRGGFVLQGQGVELNCSFEALFSSKRDELEPEVAAVLFETS